MKRLHAHAHPCSQFSLFLSQPAFISTNSGRIPTFKHFLNRHNLHFLSDSVMMQEPLPEKQKSSSSSKRRFGYMIIKLKYDGSFRNGKVDRQMDLLSIERRTLLQLQEVNNIPIHKSFSGFKSSWLLNTNMSLFVYGVKSTHSFGNISSTNLHHGFTRRKTF